jgi:hypothetical protein
MMQRCFLAITFFLRFRTFVWIHGLNSLFIGRADCVTSDKGKGKVVPVL